MEFKDFDYDLKDEIQEYQQCTGDDLYKFLLYKSSTIEKDFDCDRCSYAKAVYQKLWGFDSTLNDNFQNVSVGQKKILMGMDTMNSFWITFAWCINTWCKEDLQMIFGVSNITAESANILLRNYDALKRMLVKNLSNEVFDKLLTFAKLTHTIGNLVLVPKYIRPYTQGTQTFNQARASQCNDYFDLSLQWILKNDEPVWDASTVNSYFDVFMLRDYVTTNNQIIPFTDTHKKIIYNNTNNESRPKNREELIQLLDNINNKIINRGKKMHKMLMDINNDINQQHENTVQNKTPVENQTVNMQKKSNLFKGQEKGFFVKSLICFILVYFVLGLLLAGFLLNCIHIIDPYTQIITQIIICFLMGIVLPILLGTFSANKRRIRYIKSHSKGSVKAIRIFTFSWKVTLGIIVLIIILGFAIGALGEDKFWDSRVVRSFCEMVGFGITILCPILVWGILHRCRNCKMLFMLKKTETNESSRDDISVKVKVDRKDLQGNVVGTQDQWIPGTRIWYRKYYRCKACGQIHYSTYSKDYTNT